ncbi:hypothetical protein FCV25MIE_01605 [Fagus crenata]
MWLVATACTNHVQSFKKRSKPACKQCDDFEMDIGCTLFPNTIHDIKSEQIQHFLHGHPLSLRKNKVDEEVVHCCVCGKGCTDLPSLPSIPPVHPLALLQRPGHGKTCNACRKPKHTFEPHCNSIAYICQGHDCDFVLHAECSTVTMPAITYEGHHDHLLQFRENNTDDELKWSTCNYNICESYAFTCLYCDLNLHLGCGQLPYIIKHKCHMDPLVLTNSPVQEEEEEEEKEDDTYELYCDACEEERDPLVPVYYCAECHYVAEIKCVISEKEQVQKTLTLFHFLKSWSKDEIEQLNSVWRRGNIFNITKEDDHEDSVFEAFLFSDKAYTRVLDRGTNIPEPFKKFVEVRSKWAPKEEVVSVGDYMVTLKLAPILKHLLSKHGDIM